MLYALSDFISDLDQHSTHMLGLFRIWHESRHFASVFLYQRLLSNAERKVEIGVFIQTDICAHHGVHPHKVTFSLFLCFSLLVFGFRSLGGLSLVSSGWCNSLLLRHPPEHPLRHAATSWIKKSIFILIKMKLCVYYEYYLCTHDARRKMAPPPFKAEPEWSIECVINDAAPRHLLFRRLFLLYCIVSVLLLPHRL